MTIDTIPTELLEDCAQLVKANSIQVIFLLLFLNFKYEWMHGLENISIEAYW